MLAEDGGSKGPSPQTEPTHSDSATPRVLTVLAYALEKLVARNDELLVGLTWMGTSLSPFHGVRTPTISIPKYLERLYKYTGCSPSCFVVGYLYIDRLIHRHPDSLVVSLNVHRLLVTSVLVASKMLDDEHYNNAFFARVGGIRNAELNRLEVEFLFLLDFGVMVTSRVFESYCLHLEKEMILNGDGLKIEKPLISIEEVDVAELEDTDSSPAASTATPN